VGAVAADQVVGGHLLGPPVVVAQHTADAGLVGVEGDQLQAPLDPHAPGGQVLDEDLFGVGLGDEQQKGVSGVGQAEPEQPDPHGPAAGVELDPHRVVAARQQLLGHADSAQDLQGARLGG
jgi:hypothetical protein